MVQSITYLYEHFVCVTQDVRTATSLVNTENTF